MGTTTKKKIPDLIFRNGKPAAVILDIEEYEEILERLEDIEDLQYIHELRQRKAIYKDLDEILSELGKDV